VGQKLGEFSPTRKFGKHGGKIQRELDQQRAMAAQMPAPAVEKK